MSLHHCPLLSFLESSLSSNNDFLLSSPSFSLLSYFFLPPHCVAKDHPKLLDSRDLPASACPVARQIPLYCTRLLPFFPAALLSCVWFPQQLHLLGGWEHSGIVLLLHCCQTLSSLPKKEHACLCCHTQRPSFLLLDTVTDLLPILRTGLWWTCHSCNLYSFVNGCFHKFICVVAFAWIPFLSN